MSGFRVMLKSLTPPGGHSVKQLALALFVLLACLGRPASAQTPLTEAMVDYLGACWANREENRYADEIYCFELMQGHFIRVLRQNPGPHGMFFNESVWYWDINAQRVQTLMFTMNGAMIEADGTIEDGHFVEQTYHEETGEPQLRFQWGAVVDGTASMIRTQNLGADYGGWNEEPARRFVRQPAAVREQLLADMSFPDTLVGGVTEYFEPLLDACWETRLEDGRTDTHCFSPVFGRFVRDRHTVPGSPDYTGETLYYLDRENDDILFEYFNSIGGFSNGTGFPDGNSIEFEDEHYTGPDGTELEYRNLMSGISADGYTYVTEQLTDGEWVEVSRQHFTRAPGP